MNNLNTVVVFDEGSMSNNTDLQDIPIRIYYYICVNIF